MPAFAPFWANFALSMNFLRGKLMEILAENQLHKAAGKGP
jgi:hypothetical protein